MPVRIRRPTHHGVTIHENTLAPHAVGRVVTPGIADMLAGVIRTAALLGGATALGYAGLVSGACPIDLGIGRRIASLGPQLVDIAAPRDVVFDIVAAPYLDRTPRAMAAKLEVIERGSDMVLAAHYTPLHRRLKATTVETVRFTRPERIDFRLVRGPVPHVVEAFILADHDGATQLRYEGEIGADLWRLGQWWSGVVGRKWNAVVADSLASVKVEAERRTATRPARTP